MKTDFDWVTNVSGDPVSWRDRTLGAWAEHALENPKELKQKVSHACRLRESNLCTSWATTTSQRALADAWFCYECGLQFGSRQAWGAHRFKKHGIKREIRQHVEGTHCVVCLFEFHARDRLIQHFERASPACREWVMDNLPRLPTETVDTLEAEAAEDATRLKAHGRHRMHASLPAARIPGPMIAPAAAVRGVRRLKRSR